METSDNINELAAAMAKAQGVIEGAAKDKTNPHFRSKYADLGNVWDACRKALTENGLSVIQTPHTDEAGNLHVVTMLTHSSGQWIRDTFTLPPTKADPQGYGSALTYMRRYALAAMVGVAPEDDDGNAASAGEGSAKPKAAQKKAPEDQNAVRGKEIVAHFQHVNDVDELNSYMEEISQEVEAMPHGYAERIREHFRKRLAALSNKMEAA